eukprot:6476579-Amphidinium_carterae.1
MGWGADEATRHVLQNPQDLATYQAAHPGPEESQPEFEGNATQPFHDDDRIAIYVGLRRILSDLWALCAPMTYQAQIDLEAYQSVETTLESHHSATTDSSASRHERITDYDPSLTYSSRIVEGSGSNLTQSILSAFSADFDDDGAFEGVDENVPFGGLILREPYTLDIEELADEEDDSPLFPGMTFAGGGKICRKPIRSSFSLPSSSWEVTSRSMSLFPRRHVLPTRVRRRRRAWRRASSLCKSDAKPSTLGLLTSSSRHLTV